MLESGAVGTILGHPGAILCNYGEILDTLKIIDGGIAGGLEMEHWVGWYPPGSPRRGQFNVIYHGWGPTTTPTLKEGCSGNYLFRIFCGPGGVEVLGRPHMTCVWVRLRSLCANSGAILCPCCVILSLGPSWAILGHHGAILGPGWPS